MPSKPMTVILKENNQLLVPPSVQRRAGIKAGDRVEFRVSGRAITITPVTGEDEYTPEQRRIIDAQIAEGMDDIRKGRVSRRFNTVDDMLASLKAGTKPSSRQKTRSR